MTFHSDESTPLPQINSRANLFYFLQNMSGLAAVKDRKSGGESTLSTEQIETRPEQSA